MRGIIATKCDTIMVTIPLATQNSLWSHALAHKSRQQCDTIMITLPQQLADNYDIMVLSTRTQITAPSRVSFISTLFFICYLNFTISFSHFPIFPHFQDVSHETIFLHTLFQKGKKGKKGKIIYINLNRHIYTSSYLTTHL